jgi:hypothetical protein
LLAGLQNEDYLVVLHRPLRVGDDLDDAFAWKEERTLSQALTLADSCCSPALWQSARCSRP